jgi:hypothetical protein
MSVPDKIKQMEINPYLETIEYKEYFKFIYHNIAGSLFSGSIENLKKYSSLFFEKWTQILDEDWVQLDEAVMTIVAKEHPELFEHYYGDYDNLVSGYDHYFHLNKNMTAQVIWAAFQKGLKHENHKKSYHILQYIKPYYLCNNQKMYDYLYNYIICNYYVSPQKELDHDIVEVITMKPINLSFIKKVLSNLKFYSNFNKFIKE